jgi:hypothetical protein
MLGSAAWNSPNVVNLALAEYPVAFPITELMAVEREICGHTGPTRPPSATAIVTPASASATATPTTINRVRDLPGIALTDGGDDLLVEARILLQLGDALLLEALD